MGKWFANFGSGKAKGDFSGNGKGNFQEMGKEKDPKRDPEVGWETLKENQS